MIPLEYTLSKTPRNYSHRRAYCITYLKQKRIRHLSNIIRRRKIHRRANLDIDLGREQGYQVNLLESRIHGQVGKVIARKSGRDNVQDTPALRGRKSRLRRRWWWW